MAPTELGIVPQILVYIILSCWMVIFARALWITRPWRKEPDNGTD